MGKKDSFYKSKGDIFGLGSISDKTAPEQEKAEEKAHSTMTELPITPKAAPVQVTSWNAPAPERTYIGRDTVIEGNIKTKGDLEILGDIKGDIESDGKVTLQSSVTGNIKANSIVFAAGNLVGDVNTTDDFTLGKDSTMNGNLHAKNVNCSGTITGNVDIKDTLMLEETAVIIGDIKTGYMSMSRGAVIRGNVEMNTGNINQPK